VAHYQFIPALSGKTVLPGDTITFQFLPAQGTRPTRATMLAAYKAPVGNREGSPFFNDANSVDILTFPTLTIGSRKGTWGLAVLFTVETTEDGHFYFLPDPEIIVGPE
jgi:hypothetical protein